MIIVHILFLMKNNVSETSVERGSQTMAIQQKLSPGSNTIMSFFVPFVLQPMPLAVQTLLKTKRVKMHVDIVWNSEQSGEGWRVSLEKEKEKSQCAH